MGMLILLLSTSVCLYLIFSLIKFLHKVCWIPIRIENILRAQGIKGPSYKFIYGNSKEISNMRKESMSRPMDISHNMFCRFQPDIYSWLQIYGKNFINWHGPQAQIVVTDSEMVKEILNDRDGDYPKPDTQFYVKKLLGNGLVTSAGEKWAKQRKLANHAFHGESLKGMIPTMITSAEMMLERWKNHEGKEIEVFQEFKLMTSEVISKTAFGSSYVEGKNIFEMLLKLGMIVSRNAFQIRFPCISKIFKSEDDIEAEKLEKGIRDSVMEMIKNREEKVMSGEVENFGTDFLGLLVDSNHDTDKNKQITVEDMVDECKTFYLTGQETTSTLLTWTVFLLAIHQDWQEEARKEVLKLCGQQIPNSDGIARLKTMNMIIHETLRLYPPTVGFQRTVKREVRLGKLLVPANTNLFVPILARHHDPIIWGEDSHLFKPERFSEGVAKATNNNMAAFLAFGMGPRNCVGMNFATTEAKIALSMILQRYTFTLSPNYVHSPIHSPTTRPQHGVQILLHPV